MVLRDDEQENSRVVAWLNYMSGNRLEEGLRLLSVVRSGHGRHGRHGRPCLLFEPRADIGA